MSDQEVVRRLTISATATGVDETTSSVNKLADSTVALAKVTDTNATRALSAEAAWNKLHNSLDPIAKSQAAIEKATNTLNAALEQGVINQDQYNKSLEQLKDKYSEAGKASEDAGNGFSLAGVEAASIANHIRQAAEAAYILSPAFRAMVNPIIAEGLGLTGKALAAIGPTAEVVAASLVTRLLPALSVALRIAGPILLVVDAIKLVGYAWDSAGEQIQKYNDIAKTASDQNVTTDFLQRLGKSFEEYGQKVEDATTILTKFNQVSQEKVGGSSLSNKLDEHIQVGNLEFNPNIDSVVGTEAKYRAIVELMDNMVADGKKLAAIDIASTFASPAQVEAFRANSNYFSDILEKAGEIEQKDLVKQEDIDRAVALQSRYDAAVKILGERWIPFQETITAGGTLLKSAWVDIVEAIASAVTGIIELAKRISALQPPDWLKTIASTVGRATIGMLPFGGAGLAAYDYASSSDNSQLTDAQKELARGLSNKYTVQGAMKNATGTYDQVFKDTSHALGETVDETQKYNDAVDRAINTLQRHIEQQKADTQAIGLGDGALAAFRATAAETAAVQANGGKETDAQKEAFAKLKVEAQDAADALAKAKVASEISRGSQTAFLSPQDVQIANQLKGIYGDDIPRALRSAEAEAIRYNDTMKSLNDLAHSLASTFATDLVNGLRSGESAMTALGKAATNISNTLTSKAFTDLFSGNFIQAGVEGIGAVISGIFGSDQAKKDQQAAELKAAQDQAAQANAAAADRRTADLQAAQVAGIDQTTLAGQLAVFDISSAQQRAAEAKAGNGAIVELEKKLAAERQAIVDKSNQAIAKSMTDFLNSIKTGSLSTLSQGDQLAYEQNLFNTQLAGAKNGDSASLNSLTTTAQALLTLAQNFYASGTGYAATYNQVTEAIQSIAGGPGQVVMKDPGITNTADVTAGIAYTGFDAHATGVGYASGGVVANGKYGVDSVTARLAGGEHVTRAGSVNANTIGALSYINATGRRPQNDNSELIRILTQGFNGQTSVLSDRLDNIADRIARLENVTRQTSNQRRVPGTKAA